MIFEQQDLISFLLIWNEEIVNFTANQQLLICTKFSEIKEKEWKEDQTKRTFFQKSHFEN